MTKSNFISLITRYFPEFTPADFDGRFCRLKKNSMSVNTLRRRGEDGLQNVLFELYTSEMSFTLHYRPYKQDFCIRADNLKGSCRFVHVDLLDIALCL